MAHRILIVDDDPQARLVLAYILKRKGFDVFEAESGAAALAAVGRDSPDLVLLDVMMPDMDGFEICAALRARRPGAELPIVMLTAKTDADAHKRGLRAGANDYLVKPVRADELVARLQAALAGEVLEGRPAREP
jgi:two-component system response regulator MtrA